MEKNDERGEREQESERRGGGVKEGDRNGTGGGWGVDGLLSKQFRGLIRSLTLALGLSSRPIHSAFQKMPHLLPIQPRRASSNLNANQIFKTINNLLYMILTQAGNGATFVVELQPWNTASDVYFI